ncbi:hypothetical protein FACS1894133_4340 [Clostridia bacterium]|nr:hypothetical protein FACS1894133_4340 [Clostridia bacterium]
MPQLNFSEAPQIIAPNGKHIALILLLDVSESMGWNDTSGARPIDELNAGISDFQRSAASDRRVANTLDVAVVAFNHEADLHTNWTPVEYLPEIILEANGGTDYNKGIRLSIDKINERIAFYKDIIGPNNIFKPWIVMITDGSHDDRRGSINDIANEVRKMEEQGKLRFWAIGAGDNYDNQYLHALTDKVLKVKNYDFKELFDWLFKSMRSVSQSSPADTPKLPMLPKNVDKDPNTFNI